MDPWKEFWRRLDRKVKLAAQASVRGHTVPTNVDYQDLAQATMIDLTRFVEERRAERPEATPEDIEEDVIRWGGECLHNNMLDLARKHSRRMALLAEERTAGKRAWAYNPFRPRSASLRAEILDWVDKVRRTTRSPRMHAILQAIAFAVDNDLDVTRKDIAAIAGVQANDMNKFDRLTAKFDAAVERNAK